MTPMTIEDALHPQELWTPRDVADYLRVSRSTIYNLVGRRAIPHRRIGALIRFVPGEVRSWAMDSTP